MKKLLLLLFAVLLFVPPGRAAEETITIIAPDNGLGASASVWYRYITSTSGTAYNVYFPKGAIAGGSAISFSNGIQTQGSNVGVQYLNVRSGSNIIIQTNFPNIGTNAQLHRSQSYVYPANGIIQQGGGIKNVIELKNPEAVFTKIEFTLLNTTNTNPFTTIDDNGVEYDKDCWQIITNKVIPYGENQEITATAFVYTPSNPSNKITILNSIPSNSVLRYQSISYTYTTLMPAPTIGNLTLDKYGYPMYDDAAKVLSFVQKDVDIVVNNPGGIMLFYATGDVTDDEILTKGQMLSITDDKATISLKDKALNSETKIKVRAYDGSGGASKVLEFTAKRVPAPINVTLEKPVAVQYGFPRYIESAKRLQYLTPDITLTLNAPDGIGKLLYTIDGYDPVTGGREIKVENGKATLELKNTGVEQLTTVRIVAVDDDNLTGEEFTLECERMAAPTAPAAAPQLVGYYSGDAPEKVNYTSAVNFYGKASMHFNYSEGDLFYYLAKKDEAVTDLQPATDTDFDGNRCFVIKDERFLSGANPVTEMDLYVAQAKVFTDGSRLMGPMVKIPMRIKGPDVPTINATSGYIQERGNISFVNNSLRVTVTPAGNNYEKTSFIEYQMCEAQGNNWPEAADPDKWTKLYLNDQNGAYLGENESVYPFATGRFFVRAGRPAGEGSNLSVYSDVVYIDITRMDAASVKLGNKSEWALLHGEGALVQNGEDWKITGFYHTDAPGKPDYLYLTDTNGNVIKITGKNMPEMFSTIMQPSYAAYKWVLPAGSITGRLHFIEGDKLVEIHATGNSEDFIGFLGNPANKNDFTVPADTKYRTSVDPAADFNRYVELRSLTWLGNSKMRMADGSTLAIYPRLQVDGYQFNSNDLVVGKMYRVKGFIGIADGDISIFPIAKIDQCPGTPTLFAPNPVGEPAEGDNGVVKVKAISSEVEFTVRGNANGESKFKYSINGAEPEDVTDGKFTVKLSEIAGDKVNISVYAVLGDMTSLVPAKVEITKVKATPISSIKDFKTAVLNDFEGIKNTIYQLTGGKVLVEEKTEKYLYVRDYDESDQNIANGEDGYLRRLLIRNDNHWNADITVKEGNTEIERPIKVGDILTGFALKAEDINGNIVSNSTGFARTFKYAGKDEDNVLKAEERMVNSIGGTTFALANEDRMRLLTLQGVTVTRSGSAPDVTYTLDLDPSQQVRMRIGDVFEFRGGWAEAYEAGTPFNLTGVVLIDGKDSGKFSFALLDFSGTSKLAAPAVHLAGATEGIDEIEQPFTTGSIVMSLPNGAPADAKIYYSKDGLDPLHNLDSREEYTGEIALGTADMEIRAFVAAPGYTPSDVVVRRFTRSSRDVQFILNFLQTAEKGKTYRFTGDTRIVAAGGDYIFVAGRVGHYLPIRRNGGWDGIEGIEPGKYLSGFTVGFDIDASGNRVAVADGFESTFTPAETSGREISYEPDETTALDAATHPRRYVRLRNVRVSAPAAAAAAADGDIAWTLTESGDGGEHALIPGKLGEVKIVERDSEDNETAVAGGFADGKSYDIEGFVMLNAAREAAMEMWPLKATLLQTTGAVKASFSAGAIEDAAEADGTIPVRFEGMTMVTLSCDTKNAVIYYALGEGADNLRWYEYQRPIAVTADEYIHAKAIAPNAIESGHTHIRLSAMTQSGDIVFTPAAADGETTLTIAAKGEVAQGTLIYYSTGADRSCNKLYTAPLKFTEETLVHACLQEPGKSKGAVYSIQVMVMDYPEVPEVPEDIEAKGNSLRFSQTITEEGWVEVTIEPVTPVEGGTIYYTTEVGKKLPSEGIKYEKPVLMKESGVIIAIMTIEGKPASQAYETTVWVVPVTTGIDGVSGEGENAVRVDGSDIIAPEGSEVFDLNGRRVNPTGLASGVYIVRTPDGKAVKVRI